MRTKTELNRPITIAFTGYGHYRISMQYRNKTITAITTCMPDIDDYKDDNDRRHNKGYRALRGTVINANTIR